MMNAEQQARFNFLTPEQKEANAKYWREFRSEDKIIWKVGNFLGLARKPLRKAKSAVKKQTEIFMRGFRNRF
jgi:hypothetical protein